MLNVCRIALLILRINFCSFSGRVGFPQIAWVRLPVGVSFRGLSLPQGRVSTFPWNFFPGCVGTLAGSFLFGALVAFQGCVGTLLYIHLLRIGAVFLGCVDAFPCSYFLRDIVVFLRSVGTSPCGFFRGGVGTLQGRVGTLFGIISLMLFLL
jgi:hypothetical protein